MNPRIKKAALASQLVYEVDGKSISAWEHYVDLSDELEKFAELIVEEMYVFMCNSTDNDKPWPSFKEVKEHFGVEE